MRRRKYSFRHFQYRECDAFARYLEKQAAKGWHLKDWRFGLFFEKGEPKKVKYAVEVFPKGDERASRPEQDAEEFAEYCQAAGWELVDGRRKFCIFRAIRSDAIPIATPEERYENICKSEREHLWMPVLFIFLALFIVKLMQGRIYRYAFEYSQLFLILFMVLMAVCSATDGAAALFWRWKKKRQLDAGEEPCYGRTFGISYEWYVYIMLPGLMGLQVAEAAQIGGAEVFSAVVPYSGVILIGIVGFISAVFRPSVNRRIWIQGGLAVTLIFAFFCIAGILVMREEPEPVSETYAPLKQEDFKDVTGEPYIYREEKETFLGKKYEYYISYGNDEVRTDQMRYEGYESPYAWVIERLWEPREKWDSIFLPGTPNNRAVSEKIDSKELWGAEAAWMYQIGEPSVENYCYELRYPNEVVILHTMEELDAEAIQIVREKLGLR